MENYERILYMTLVKFENPKDMSNLLAKQIVPTLIIEVENVERPVTT
jgi:hypothetical protein